MGRILIAEAIDKTGEKALLKGSGAWAQGD